MPGYVAGLGVLALVLLEWWIVHHFSKYAPVATGELVEPSPRSAMDDDGAGEVLAPKF